MLKTEISRTTKYRRIQKAKKLGCSVEQLCDGRGHNHKASGSDHYRWNKGRIVNEDGYTKVRVGIGHPLADSIGYAYEHLVVWCAAGNSRPGKGELIHHKNEDKSDNRYENLELTTRKAHNQHHNREKQRGEDGRFFTGRLLHGAKHNEFPGGAQ